MSAPGDVVAVSLPNIPHHLVPVLGSIHAGRAFQSQSKTGGIPVLKIWIRTLYLQPKVLCKFLLHIIDSIKPNTVDFSKLKDSNSEEDQISNINYTIASARKLGAEVLALWQHIKESNSKYVGILLA